MSIRTYQRMPAVTQMRRKSLVLISLLLALNQQAFSEGRQAAGQAHTIDVFLLWNGNSSGADSTDQESFAAMVASMGFQFSRIDAVHLQKTSFGHGTLLMIPHASAIGLSAAQAQSIVAHVRRGVRLMTDGISPLSAALPIEIGSAHRVSQLEDKSGTEMNFSWPDQPRVPWILGMPPGSHVLFADSASGHPLSIAAGLGRGGIIYMAPLLDEVSGRGYARFPTLIYAISDYLHCLPIVRRSAVDAYFDPGYRYTIPIENLAAKWSRWGIRAVHAAAWYSNRTPPYDYRRLIQTAHENGILVYAWLEWPHVGEGFWNQHPQWRQKNALLQDAKLDFLHLMDLQNPDCMRAALDELSNLLKEDWDGIDVAEFTITGAGGEALAGPARPDYFVSFAEPARNEFKRLAGFDPLELENPNSLHYWRRDPVSLEKFYRYRTDVNNHLLRQVFEFIKEMKDNGRRDWELIHTIVDNSLHPEFDHLLGFDLNSTLALVKEFGMTLNVEDPYMEWTQPPDRYRRLRKTLESLVPDRPAMIDINVVPVHPATQVGFASPQATGTELLQQIQAAGERHGRVCIYCESSVYEKDWDFVPYAMVAGTTISKVDSGWRIDSPSTCTLSWLGNGREWLLDGKEWRCFGNDGIIVPAGNHRLLSIAKSTHPGLSDEDIRLIAISDELLGCETAQKGIELTYASPARCVLSFNVRPGKTIVDGTPTELPVLKGQDGFVVLAPSGRHRVSIFGQ